MQETLADKLGHFIVKATLDLFGVKWLLGPHFWHFSTTLRLPQSELLSLFNLEQECCNVQWDSLSG